MRTMHAPAPSGHQPALLTETIAAIQPRAGGRYLDGTFGGGGHTRAILAASAPDGIVLALDADPAAIARGEALRAELTDPSRLRLVHANFADLARVANDAGFAPVDGMLLDLGLSSFQLDEAARGFAFRHEGPLDMRFDAEQGRPAADLVNELPQDALADLIYRYGEEPRSRRIAAAIVRARGEAPILTTTRLAEIVSRAAGGRRGREIHPATRTFQALRIAVNGELEVLPQALEEALSVLAPGGRLVVIAFHSLEDRIVKRFFQRERAGCICPPEQPVCTCGHQPRLRTLTRAVRAGAAEQASNPRSRSATLRAAERLGEGTEAREGEQRDASAKRIPRSARDSSPGLSDGSRLKPTVSFSPPPIFDVAASLRCHPERNAKDPRAKRVFGLLRPLTDGPASPGDSSPCGTQNDGKMRGGIERIVPDKLPVGCSRRISLSPGLKAQAGPVHQAFERHQAD